MTRTERRETRDAPHAEVAIVGGGPAGAAAATLLASWGHDVVLLTKTDRQPSLGESLPPSCQKLMQAVGVADAVDRAGFTRSRGNTVWWSTSDRRSEDFAGGQLGHQVLRSDFDRVLLGCAERAGAHIVGDATVRDVAIPEMPARVVSPVPTGPLPSAPIAVKYEAVDGTPAVVEARFVLDCTGRAGVIARRGLRSPGRFSTVALVGVWERPQGWGLTDETHTLVEAYEDGWAWSVPTRPDCRHVAAMVDPRATEMARGGDLARLYAAELRKAPQLAKILAGARLQEGTWACDASMYSASQYAGPGFVLVGDAATFIDPLSSYGVKKALASGWLAAIVAHTGLVRPEMWPVACDFFSRREQDMYALAVRQAAAYFAQAAASHAHAFWTWRAADPPGLLDTEIDIDALRRDPDVMRAFVNLKRASAIDLQPADALRIERRPAVSGREIVLEEGIVSAAFASGIRYLRGVDLVALVRMAGTHSQVPELYEAYNRTHAPVGLPDFLGALAVLLGKGCVENRITT